MRSLDAAEISALQAGTVIIVDLVWLTAYSRQTGNPVQFGFYSDVGRLTCDVVDGLTGLTVERTFYGNTIVEVGSVMLVSDLSIRPVEIKLNPLNEYVESALREYDPRGGPVQIYRAFLDTATRLPVAPAKTRFVGFVDEAPIVTPAEGGEASARISCASLTRELTRINPAVRSNEDQHLRDPDDDFYRDTASVGDWQVDWGNNRSSAPTEKRGKRFLESEPLGDGLCGGIAIGAPA